MTNPHDVAADLWSLAGGEQAQLEALQVDGPAQVLPSVFDVTTAATASVAAAALAIAEFDAARRGTTTAAVHVDSRHATLSFRDEKHALIDGKAPEVWADLSGYYETSDGFVQIHANFAHHGERALGALGLAADATRPEVEAVLQGWSRFDAEAEIVANDGICSAFRSATEWAEHPHAKHLGDAPPVLRSACGEPRHHDALETSPGGSLPLSGVRVLDLTRILAGPVAARTMAAFGADVIRVGADGLASHELSVALTSLGKRFAHIDLRAAEGRGLLFSLVAKADVVLTAFRPGSLGDLGVTPGALREANPSLVLAELSAFGKTGPWGGRRGFDSITQTASGIAHDGMLASNGETPSPLPCQLLDYASGYLLALGIVRSLTDRLSTGSGYEVEVVLARTGHWLRSLPRVESGADIALPDDVADLQQTRPSPFGQLTHMRQPGTIGQLEGRWSRGPERPGQSEPRW